MSTCYRPNKSDNDIANVLNNRLASDPNNKGENKFSAGRIAAFRAIHDSMLELSTDKKLFEDKYPEEDRVDAMSNFINQLISSNWARTKSFGTNIRKAYDACRKLLTTSERVNRTEMIARMVIKRANSIATSYPERSRKEIYKGFKEGGRAVGGQAGLFDSVYYSLMDRMIALKQRAENPALDKTVTGRRKKATYEDQAQKILDTLNSWPSLVIYARERIRQLEGIKLGNQVNFVSYADVEDFGDNLTADYMDEENPNKEHWQETDYLRSSFGSLTKRVRLFISTLPLYETYTEISEEGGIKDKVRKATDDLGFTMYLDPVTVHRKLLDIFRGITNSNQMLDRLGKRDAEGHYEAKEEWAIPIVEELQKNPQFKTQLYVSYKKSFCIYTKLNKVQLGKVFEYRWQNLNKKSHGLYDKFLKRIVKGEALTPSSVYHKNGKVNWSQLSEAVRYIDEWLKVENVAAPTSNTNIFAQRSNSPKSKFWRESYMERRKFISNISSRLGIDLDASTVNNILRNSKATRLFLKQIKDIVDYGLGAAGLTTEDIANLRSGEVSTFKDRQYIDLITHSNKRSSIKEKVGKILNIAADLQGVSKVERSARFKNRRGIKITMYSDINPSYMGDRFSDIEAYVNADDKAGLKEYLEVNYLRSSFFMHNGKILNKWLEELYLSSLSMSEIKDYLRRNERFEREESLDAVAKSLYKESLSESFAGQFTYNRLMGSTDFVFEDFTSQKHGIAMLEHFWSKANKTGYAMYPVFVMGDSGASKWTTAKKYTIDECKEILYNVFKQECRRMAQVKAFKEWINEKEETEGKSIETKGLENFLNGEDKFTMLPFLNGKVTKDSSKNEVIDAITKYIEGDDSSKGAVDKFKDRLTEYGVLEKSGNEYTHIRHMTPENVDERLKEYFWNTKVATIQQLQLMTLDTSFYKNTEDLQKRYKEIHAPGLALDIYAEWPNDEGVNERVCPDGIERCIYYNDKKIDTEVSDPAFYAALKNKFKGSKSKSLEAYHEATLTDGQSYRTLKSYRAVKIMNGDWDSNMERAYKEILNIRANGVTTPADIDRLAELATVFQPIKPYLYTHERIALNGNEELLIPVQHKCSEAILIPELLPDCMLKDLAEIMESENIDLAASTEVVKVGEFGAVNIIGSRNTTNKEELRQAINKGYVHELDMRDYRIQTNVPEHVYDSRLFGTQIRKLMMSGVIEYNKDGTIKNRDKDYNHYVGAESKEACVTIREGSKEALTPKNLVAFYNSLIVANILESQTIFEDNVATYSRVSQILSQGVLSNDRDSVELIMSYALAGDGNFSLPLFDFGIEHDSAALLLSCFKKIVNKQKINGGSAVQVSSMGIDGYKEDGGLAFICTDAEGNEIRSTDPDFEDKKDKIVNVKYAECVMPWDLRYTSKEGKEVELEYSKYCNLDGTLKMTEDGTTSLLEKEFPGILDLIAYRIPTEKAYSTMNLKVKRFTPKINGGTIAVPASGTVIAGFDFDIDKLYLMRKEFLSLGVDENGLHNWESYDLDKTADKNSRVARNNMLFEIMRQRLMDEETFEDRYSPQGFEEAKKSARKIRDLELTSPSQFVDGEGNIDWETLDALAKDKSKDPRPNYDPTEPDTIITYNQQNQIADKLIGMFANQNANYMFSSLMRTFKLKKPILFGGHTVGEGFGEDMLHSPEGRNNASTLAEFLASSVDAVKEPVLNYLGFNTLTASSASLLARLGYNSFEIGLLFRQPIIREVCETAFNKGYSLSVAIQQISYKYLNKGESLNKKEKSTSELNLDILAKSISAFSRNKNLMENDSFVDTQLGVLELFSRVATAATELNDFIAATRFTAANSVGSTFGQLYAQQYRVRDYLEKYKTNKDKNLLFDIVVAESVRQGREDITTPVDDSESNLSLSTDKYMDLVVDNPFAFEQCMYDMNRRTLKRLMKYYPYNASLYRRMRERLNNTIIFGTLKGDLIDLAHQDLLSFILSKQSRTEFCGEAPSPYSPRETNREYYAGGSFIKHLSSEIERRPELKEHPFVKAIEIRTEVRGGELFDYLVVPDILSYKAKQKDEFKDAWSSFLEVAPELARGVFFYNYYRAGNNFSYLSFNHLAPTVLKESIPMSDDANPSRTYRDFLYEVQDDEYNYNLDDFVIQFILNHSDRDELVFSPKVEDVKNNLIRLATGEGGSAVNSFIVDVSANKKLKKSIVINKSSNEEVETFVPAIRIGEGENSILYIAQSESSDLFNISTNHKMKYVRAKRVIGKTNTFSNYFEKTEYALGLETPTIDYEDEGQDSERGITGDDGADEVREMSDAHADELISQYKNELIKEIGKFMNRRTARIKLNQLFDGQTDIDRIREIFNKVKSNIEKQTTASTHINVFDINGEEGPLCG